MIDRIQQLTERRNQLTASLTTAQTAYQTAMGRVEQARQQLEEPAVLLDEQALQALEERVAHAEQVQQECVQRVEGLQLEQVRMETRISLLRKQAVSE